MMSWQASRYRKSLMGSRRRGFHEVGRHASRSLPKKGLAQVFDSGSVERALAICLRLQRMKRRTHGDGRIPFRPRRCSGRNYHHLTPQSRRNQPYHGTESRNMVLIHIPRHEAWHALFKLQTLEETIALLMACITESRECYFAAEVVIALFLKARTQRSAKRILEKWKRREG
jgi:hypothetical protein